MQGTNYYLYYNSSFSSSSSSFITLCFLLLVSLSTTTTSVEAYKNYTVGDSLGWYDTTEKPNLSYQKWASSINNFSLGDFLIFNTNTNHSVVQTYNLTTYKACDYDDAQEKDTIQWSAGNPSNTAPLPVSVAVPLVKEGMNYFFSGDYDGDQCKSGQHFKINVTHGQGLPKSLQNNPTPGINSPSSPGPANSPESGDGDDSIPDTIVPSNFNNPKEESADGDDKDLSGSASLSIYVNFRSVILLGLVCLLS